MTKRKRKKVFWAVWCPHYNYFQGHDPCLFSTKKKAEAYNLWKDDAAIRVHITPVRGRR